MSTEAVAARIKQGVLALPIGGIIYALSILLLGEPTGSPDNDPEGFAQKVVSARYSAAVLGLAISTILYLFGRFALYVYLAGSRVERWALAGSVLVVVFLASYLAIMGGALRSTRSLVPRIWKATEMPFRPWPTQKICPCSSRLPTW